MRDLATCALYVVVVAVASVLVIAAVSARDAAIQTNARAVAAARAAATDARGSAELVASCEAQARADLDAAHARIRALESSLRAIAATSPCRVRLPRPIDDAPRPLWCEDRTSWWSEPLPTLGVSCYPAEARVLDWHAED